MKPLYFIIVLLMYHYVGAQSWEHQVLQGIKAYRSNQLNRAEQLFEKAYQLADTSTVAIYNLANSKYQQGKITEALPLYQQLAKNTKLPKAHMATIQYNVGVAMAKLRQWQGAVEAFKQSLRLQPNDIEAQQNLQMALHHLPPPPKKQNRTAVSPPPPKANSPLSKQQLEKQLQQLALQEKQLQQQLQQQKTKQMGANKDW